MRAASFRTFAHFVFITLAMGLFFACASPQFYARPGEGVTIMPDGKTASIIQEGLALHAAKINTPYGLGSKIVTFRVTLVNPTDTPIEFIPKQYYLFDQNNRQYLALTKPDLSEAADLGGRPGGSISWGFGMGTFHSRSMYALHYYSNPYWYNDPWGPRRSYQGLLGKALPIHPVTVFPHAQLEGNVYFAVPPSTFWTARLQIVRFAEIPEPEKPVREITYCLDFTVEK